MTVRTVGVVLAGGASRRMGGSPKAAMTLGRETLLERAAARLGGQVDVLVVNSNDDLTLDGVPTVRDPFEDRRGPLAGVLAAVMWARENHPTALHVASVPVDVPHFPLDLVERLQDIIPNDGCAIARAGGHPQPVFGLWPVAMEEALRSFLLTSGTLKIMEFVDSQDAGVQDFDDVTQFENVNTPDDLDAARERLGD